VGAPLALNAATVAVTVALAAVGQRGAVQAAMASPAAEPAG
jgi:hypothetical protein